MGGILESSVDGTTCQCLVLNKAVNCLQSQAYPTLLSFALKSVIQPNCLTHCCPEGSVLMFISTAQRVFCVLWLN